MVPEEIILIMVINHKNKRILYIYFNKLDNLLGTPSFHTEGAACHSETECYVGWMQHLLTRSRWTGQAKSMPQ